MTPIVKLDDPGSPSRTSSFRPATPNTASVHEEDWEALHRSNANAGREETRVTDRGARAWLAVVAGFINFFAGFGLLNSWGTFQAKYPDEPWGKSTSLAEISWIGSVQPGLLFALGGFAGYASDKISAALLSRIGTVLFVASYLLVAEYVTSYAIFLALQGFLFSLSNTLLCYPVTSVISDWFERRRGLALGICASGSSLGGIFWPIVVDELHKNYGIKRALQGVALVPLIPLIVASCLVKERRSHRKITLHDLWSRCFNRGDEEHQEIATTHERRQFGQ